MDARVDGDDLAGEYETQPDDGQEAEGVEPEKEEGRFREEGHLVLGGLVEWRPATGAAGGNYKGVL